MRTTELFFYSMKTSIIKDLFERRSDAPVDLSPSQDSSRRTYLNFVDVLRGFALILVMVRHYDGRLPFAETIWAQWFPQRIQDFIFDSSLHAVRIFFVASGFLITRTALQKWGDLGKIEISSFYKFRLARIGPSLFLILFLLSLLHLLNVRTYVIDPEISTLPRALFSVLTFHVNWLTSHLPGRLPGAWMIFWTLSVEEMFYFFFPLVCWVLKKEKYLVWLLFLFILGGPLTRQMLADNPDWQAKSYLSCMDNLAMGCLAALAVWRFQFQKRTLHFFFAAGTVLCVFVLFCRPEARQLGIVSHGLNSTLLGLGISLILVARTPLASTKSFKGFDFFRRFGVNNYEIYLFHIVILKLGVLLFRKANLPLDLGPFYFIFLLGVSLLWGELVRKYFSDPLRAKIRRL